MDSVQTSGARVESISAALMSAPRAFAASGFQASALRTNLLLRKYEWEQFDRAVVKIAYGRLVGVADLQQMGLTHPLGSLGVLLAEYEKQTDMGPAQIDMDGTSPAPQTTLGFDSVAVPIPVIHSDYRLSLRRLEASRLRPGTALDTAGAIVAARKVAEAQENLLFNGSTKLLQQNHIYGYTTHPDRNTGSLTAAWDAGTGTDIIGDVVNMIAAAVAANMFGPYHLYIPQTYMTVLQEDYNAYGRNTYLGRLLQIQGLEAIKASSELAAPNVVLVQMTRDVVDWAYSMDISNLEWGDDGGFIQNFRVMTAGAPRVKSDQEGHCGVVHFS